MIRPSDIPGEVLGVMHHLFDHGHQAYLVGGCVRDHLLGKTPKDYDIATSAHPETVMGLFHKVIPTGIRYGTVTVMEGDMAIEVTTFRADGNYSDGRRPDAVTFSETIEEDLSRRDFTINAMAWTPFVGLVNPFHGLEDLREGIIKAVGDPLERFTEDALRMLRAVRFTVTLGFDLAPGLAGSIFSRAFMIENISAERIREELNKILLSPEPSRGPHLLFKTGLLHRFLPELCRCYAFDQHNPHHRKNVFDHILIVLKSIPPVLHLRLAALLHDIAKPETFTIGENGIGHFYGHEDVGATMTEEILTRLKYDRDTIDKVVRLVQNHMFAGEVGVKAMRRLIVRVGAENIPDLLALRLADVAGSKTPSRIEYVDRIREVLAEMQTQGIANPSASLAVTGRDVMEALGIGPGRAVGEALALLTEAVLDNPEMNNREALLAELSKAFGGTTKEEKHG